MFEAAEVGRSVSREAFRQREPELHAELLAAQRELATTRRPVVVIVSGVEGAGKGQVVNQLNAWLDTRGTQTWAFWDETDEEAGRPYLWRFWRRLPPRGSIGIMFGSWYTRPIVERAFRRISEARLDQTLASINALERQLVDDGAVLVKLWFHLSRDAHGARLAKDAKGRGKRRKLSPIARRFGRAYGAFVGVSERALRLTDSGCAPWHVIEATDRRYRDLTAGEILLTALRAATAPVEAPAAPPEVTITAPVTATEPQPTVLDRVDRDAVLELADYRRALAKQQRRLNELAWKAHRKGRSTVVLFEGWDAAGKGGAIRRITQAVDARLYRVISVAAPTDEEAAHHYLWRFWRHLPMGGHMTVYDRSWYGRVLVERVEDFTAREAWSRSYREINDFEQELTADGVILLKFWVDISAEEQLRRFEERQALPWKQHKITDEDWRNRERWDDYAQAVDEMVARTSTECAPWHLIPGNDKRYARVAVLEQVNRALRRALKG